MANGAEPKRRDEVRDAPRALALPCEVDAGPGAGGGYGHGAEDRDKRLSAASRRDVRLVRGGAFFDLGAACLLRTASLKRLGAFYPASRFDLRRFRPGRGWLGAG